MKRNSEPWSTTQFAKFDETAYFGLHEIGVEFDLAAAKEKVGDDSKKKQNNALLFSSARDLPVEPTLSFEVIALARLRGRTEEELERSVLWHDGKNAYEVLGMDHFDNYAPKIRADLADGFERLHSDWIADSERQIMSQIPSDLIPPEKHELFTKIVREQIRQTEKFEDFIREQFTAAALRILAAIGDASDLPLARDHLLSGKLIRPMGAVEIVRKYGGDADVEALIKLTRDTYSEQRVASATAALEVSVDKLAAIRSLLSIGESAVAAIALRYAVDHLEKDAAQEIAREALSSKDTGTRQEATAVLVRVSERDELERELAAYQHEGPYYYNVVCWLDRVLYAPEPLRERYVSMLNA